MYWRMYKAYRRTQLMWYFLIPILFIWTIFFFISIIKKREANINWTMFVYVVLPVMLSSYIIDYHKEKRAVVLSVITLILFSVTMTIPYWESPLSKKILPVQKDPLRKIAVWKDMSDKVDSIYRCCDSRTTFIFTDDYILAAEMMYYLYPNEHIYFFNNGTRMCQFQLRKGVEQYANRSYAALFVQLSVVNARHPHVEATLAPNIAAAFDSSTPQCAASATIEAILCFS
jgi:hypothetical protein